MNKGHQYRIGNQLILSWAHCDHLRLGELIANAIKHENKDLATIEDQELIDLIDKYCSK